MYARPEGRSSRSPSGDGGTQMTRTTLQRLTGVLFILAAVGFAVTSTVLSATFNWPDILR